jgi:hypothetical protein
MECTCKICSSESKKLFVAKVLKKYDVQYYQCPKCGFIQTETPYWLDEAYSRPINTSDTGILLRNIQYSNATALLLLFVFGKNQKYLDYAGGYGIFTRLMRDKGFDFYWKDPFTQNLLAEGFEYEKGDEIELITTFESFEHFVEPYKELEEIFKTSKNIIFSTQMASNPAPNANNWWYYGIEHGQHVAIHTPKSLKIMAHKYGLHFYTIRSFHLFTTKKIPAFIFKILAIASKLGLWSLMKWVMKSKVADDYNKMTALR